jgi:hypothetical protein
LEPTWLGVDFDYPLGDASDTQRIVEQVSAAVKGATSNPFGEIWAIWRVTNVDEVQFQIFRVA